MYFDSNRSKIGLKNDLFSYISLSGIDYFLRKKGGVYIPYGIEVNSHDCTINCQLFEFMNPSQSGYSVAPLIQTMIDRSQAFLIAGKKILLLNLGVSSKRFILDSAIQHRIKVAIEFCYCFFFLNLCFVWVFFIWALALLNSSASQYLCMVRFKKL